MKTVIIANPSAGAGSVGKRWPRYNRNIAACFGPAQVRFTQHPQDATQLARLSVYEGFERIVVVGGDGTVNEVVNGLFDETGSRFIGAGVSVAVYPSGTGGDLARSLGLAPRTIAEALQLGSDALVDVGRATITGAGGATSGRVRHKHFVNISSFGASGMIVDAVNHTTKQLGGKVSFWLGTLRGMLRYQNQRIRLRIDDKPEEELLINTVAVANGRYFGGAMKIAPQALIDDGLFDVIIIGDISAATFLRYSHRLYSGTHLRLPEIRMVRARTVVATPVGTEPVLIDLDGEQPGALPVRYEILPRLLKMYAPWGLAETLGHGHTRPAQREIR